MNAYRFAGSTAARTGAAGGPGVCLAHRRPAPHAPDPAPYAPVLALHVPGLATRVSRPAPHAPDPASRPHFPCRTAGVPR
jgi:hypothetical protein